MVSNEALRIATECLVRQFQPRRIILFGSHAQGTADTHSDVDLLVVCPEYGRARAALLRFEGDSTYDRTQGEGEPPHKLRQTLMKLRMLALRSGNTGPESLLALKSSDERGRQERLFPLRPAKSPIP